jgi:hypothetical protein
MRISRKIVFALVPLLFTTGASVPASSQASNAAENDSESGYKVSGTVVSKIDAQRLAQARIMITDVRDSKKTASLITGEDGKFVFTGLPAGKYSLTGQRRGFIAGAYDQHNQYSTAIVTGAALDTEHLLLRLAPKAIISGRILDEAGEPVRHANVALYFDDHSGGVERVHEERGAQTDDLGRYEFASLSPGTYYISATAKPWYAVHLMHNGPNSEQDQSAADTAMDRSIDVAYPTTFYADVTDADSATPIPLRGGDRVQADIHFTPAPALTLVFHIPQDSKHGFSIPTLQQSTFDGTTFVQTDGVRTISNGVVEISGIPAGQYNVRIANGDQTVQLSGVDVSKDRQEIDTSTAEPMSSVKVSVKVAGESSIPPMTGVGLRGFKRPLRNAQIVDAKGNTEFQQLLAGSYEVVAFGSGARYAIASMSVDGAEVSGHTLAIAPGSSANVSVTLLKGSAEVEGVVKKAGRPFAGAMVVLVPQNPGSNRDLFRRDQSDLDGTFTLHGVVPGSYTLLAIENGWDLGWSEPGVISAYLKGGRKIQIGDQAGRTTKVAESIEVQSQ